MRVSLPITILWRPRPRELLSRFLKTCAAARPRRKAVSAVTGSMFAVPRTPSVPKMRLGLDMELRFGRDEYLDFLRLDANLGDAGGSGNFDSFAQVGRCLYARQVDENADVFALKFFKRFRLALDRNGDLIRSDLKISRV